MLFYYKELYTTRFLEKSPFLIFKNTPTVILCRAIVLADTLSVIGKSPSLYPNTFYKMAINELR